MWKRSARLSCLALLLALPSWGCREEKVRDLLPTPLTLSPVDSASEGELAEGTDKALGLMLPRSMQVHANLGDTVYVRGLVGYDALKRYLAARLEPEKQQETKQKLVLFNAKLLAHPDERLQVEVWRRSRNMELGGRVEMVIRDRRRKPAMPGLSEKERWSQAGLTPQGQVMENQAQ